jgi:hypothetical protein
MDSRPNGRPVYDPFTFTPSVGWALAHFIATARVTQVVLFVAPVLVVDRRERNYSIINQVFPSANLSSCPVRPSPVTVPSPKPAWVDETNRLIADEGIKVQVHLGCST